MKLSSFGTRMTRDVGIVQLMDDLGAALAEHPDMRMLGGGNPGHIPAVERLFRERLRTLLDAPGEIERVLGNYDPPRGQARFARAMADLLRRELGWNVGSENIAATNGSQSASFMLLNLLAGDFDDASSRHVLLPLAPEYIGYAAQGLTDDFFVAARPTIEHLDAHTFKYHVDFEALEVGDRTAALCVSRPTNPTGNVLTDAEVRGLAALAREHRVPLILDNAYGVPFPGIVFGAATPIWNENIIVLMSLSKLGLPGVRTGIIIAREEIIRAVSAVNAVLNLTTGGFGQALTLEMIESGEIIRVGHELIRPYYQRKAEQAIAWLNQDLADYDYHVHRPEGAIFLWLWFRDLPITSRELYQRLKQRGVLVLSGHYFFPGLKDPWRHRDECLRITYSQEDSVVRDGLRVLAEEVKRAYDRSG